MKVLVTASCSEGLVLPLVPLSWALRARGHDVLVAAPANMASVVADGGLPCSPCSGPVEMPQVLSRDRAGQPVSMPRTEEGLLPHIGRGYARLALHLIDGIRDLADQWRPDLIITETYGMAGPLIAAELGIPWVEHAIRLSSPAVITEAGAAELAPELEALGLTGFPEPLVSVDVCPAGLRPARSAPAVKMRYLPYNGRVGDVPGWSLQPKRDQPRVCLTFGTRVPLSRSPIKGGLGLLKELMDRLPKLGAEVVVGVSAEVADDLGPLPAGVRSAGPLPLSQVLPACDAAVHHGGVGTTFTCLAAGVPQVTIPVIAEVWDTSRMLTAAGVAREVPFAAVSADGVTQACASVLADASYRDNAARIRQEIAAMPSAADLATVIEARQAGWG